MWKHVMACTVTLFALLFALVCGGRPAVAQTLNGAGSTFVYPAMSKWAEIYHQANPKVTVNYQSVGSGAGIEAYKAGIVDFGATDAPLTDTELAQMPQSTLHIPVIAGSEVLAYHIPGVGAGLRLSGDVIADIYLGKIRTWNDPRLASQNPGLSLPSMPIILCHRSDGSGTTYIFTDYLCSVSPEWKAKVSRGKLVDWPATSVGGNGNPGVATLIQRSPGAIGYVELAYAVRTRLTFGPVRNQRGNYVLASIASTEAAANAATEQMQKDVRVSIVNGSGVNSYPICGFTYILLAKTPKDPVQTRAVVEFLRWILGPGQSVAEKILYAPLTRSVIELDQRALAQVIVARK